MQVRSKFCPSAAGFCRPRPPRLPPAFLFVRAVVSFFLLRAGPLPLGRGFARRRCDARTFDGAIGTTQTPHVWDGLLHGACAGGGAVRCPRTYWRAGAMMPLQIPPLSARKKQLRVGGAYFCWVLNAAAGHRHIHHTHPGHGGPPRWAIPQRGKKKRVTTGLVIAHLPGP